jgi:hypothetical protein
MGGGVKRAGNRLKSILAGGRSVTLQVVRRWLCSGRSGSSEVKSECRPC